MYLKIKNELLSKLKNSNIKLEYIQAELDRIANQNQWLHWVDECAKLINYNRCNSIDKETKDDSNVYGNCTFQEITYNSKETDYIENKSNIGFPYQMLENLLSNTLESIKVDYNHEHNIHELDIKLHLPITTKPIRILSKSPFKNTQIKTTNSTNKPTSKHEKQGGNYSTVTDPKGVGSKVNTSLHSLYLVLHITYKSANLWESNYSEYQQFLFDTISEHYKEGATFKEIAEWWTGKKYYVILKLIVVIVKKERQLKMVK